MLLSTQRRAGARELARRWALWEGLCMQREEGAEEAGGEAGLGQEGSGGLAELEVS